MRLLTLCIALCTLAIATPINFSLEDFTPLALESKQIATHNAKPPSALPLAKTPQMRLWNLSAQYIADLPLLSHLTSIATTQEQRDFIEAYAIFLRISLLHFIAESVRDGYHTDFVDSIVQAQNIKLDRTAVRKHLEYAWSSFLTEQNDFILSFGAEFFHFLDTYKPREFCVSGGCGHELELLVFARTFRALQSKHPNLQAPGIDAMRYGEQGVMFFTLVTGMGTIKKSLKVLGFETLRIYPSKELEPLTKDLESFEDNVYLRTLLGYFAYEYLSRLYRVKYILQLYTHKSQTRPILESMDKAGLEPCVDSVVLPKRAQQLCQRQAQLTRDDLPTTQDRLFILQDRQNCLALHYPKDSAHLRLVLSPTNTSQICQALQKSAQKLLQDPQQPRYTPVQSSRAILSQPKLNQRS